MHESVLEGAESTSGVTASTCAVFDRHSVFCYKDANEMERHVMETLTVKTSARSELIDITGPITEIVAASGVKEGICCIYVPHTTAAVTVNENADPAVRRDILMALNKIVPLDDDYAHSEGNSAAHVKATLVGASATVPVVGGRLVLGSWQGIYLCEFDGPRSRRVCVSIR
jgi:secondary thiamine-phosphate synthase enzyme